MDLSWMFVVVGSHHVEKSSYAPDLLLTSFTLLNVSFSIRSLASLKLRRCTSCSVIISRDMWGESGWRTTCWLAWSLGRTAGTTQPLGRCSAQGGWAGNAAMGGGWRVEDKVTWLHSAHGQTQQHDLKGVAWPIIKFQYNSRQNHYSQI